MSLLWMLISIVPSSGFAHVFLQPWKSSQLPLGTTTEKAYRVIGARVVYANYPLLKMNFPQIRNKDHSDVNQWILNQFAYLSEHQEKLMGGRISFVQLDKNDFKILYRPPTYVRAGVLEADGEGLVDIKGVGHALTSTFEEEASELTALIAERESLEKELEQLGGEALFKKLDDLEQQRKLDQDLKEVYYPLREVIQRMDRTRKKIKEIRIHPHSDGVMGLGEAIHELVQQQVIQKDFNKFNDENMGREQLETVESLFIIEIPGIIYRGEDDAIGDRLALYGREAHTGRQRSPLSSARSYVYNPAPQRITTSTIRAQDWIQTDGLGNVVDYGATFPLNPGAFKAHQYRNEDGRELTFEHFQEKVKHHQYLDSHLSGVFQWSYDTANYCSQVSTEACQSSILSHLKGMVLAEGSEGNFTGPLAPLPTHLYEAQMGFYSAMRKGSLSGEQIHDLQMWMDAASEPKDRMDFIEYHHVYSLLSMLSQNQVDEILSKSSHFLKSFGRFLVSMGPTLTTDTQGRRLNDLPSLSDLLKAAEKKTQSPEIIRARLQEIRREPGQLSKANRMEFLIQVLKSDDKHREIFLEVFLIPSLELTLAAEDIQQVLKALIQDEQGQEAFVQFLIAERYWEGAKMKTAEFTELLSSLLETKRKPYVNLFILINRIKDQVHPDIRKKMIPVVHQILDLKLMTNLEAKKGIFFEQCVKARMSLDIAHLEKEHLMKDEEWSKMKKAYSDPQQLQKTLAEEFCSGLKLMAP